MKLPPDTHPADPGPDLQARRPTPADPGPDPQAGHLAAPSATAVHPAVPSVTSEVTEVNGREPIVPHPRQPGLAEQARKERQARRVRKLVIGARFLLKRRVAHPDGGERTVEEVLRDEADQRAEINEDISRGSLKHRRLLPWMRRIPKYVLVFDFGLLSYFFAGITNVNWASPLSLALAFAAVLAAMVTILSYGFLAFTGHRMRSHKNHEGTIHRDDLDGLTKMSLNIGVVVVAVLAVLMFLRMRTEVLYALGGQAVFTALVIAAAVAMVNAVANVLVILIHALDGSDQTARLDLLSAAARRPFARAHSMTQQAALQADGAAPQADE